MTMASFTIKPSLISCFVLIFLSFASSSNASNKVVDVNVICKQTTNPSFCLNILNSKPGGAKGEDLITLEQYTLDVVRGNITTALTLIKSLIAQSGKDPKTKASYEQCLLYYGGDDDNNGALDNILYAQELLKTGDYLGVGIAAAAAITNVADCSSEDNPSFDKSNLPKYSDFIVKAAGVIVIISKLLLNKQ
ncbi:hypothetical protein RIF29_05822 [Crotalaria pallida]|uniref:Pectinesterase inhibitor domain-containing protein n=1 Tax=Crotalaria pallida TaxID=3830 RepID=A0AAN9J2H5_CROPI